MTNVGWASRSVVELELSWFVGALASKQASRRASGWPGRSNWNYRKYINVYMKATHVNQVGACRLCNGRVGQVVNVPVPSLVFDRVTLPSIMV